MHDTRRRGLRGILARAGLLQCLAVVSGHPSRGMLRQLCRVSLQFRQVVEGIGVVQFAGTNGARVQVAHLGTFPGFVEQQGSVELSCNSAACKLAASRDCPSADGLVLSERYFFVTCNLLWRRRLSKDEDF
jgi:hypothetical protein